tara:strand:+ start:1302 stop:1835 length:534 start_codon:yes stop_codon:yes gene_type:complete
MSSINSNNAMGIQQIVNAGKQLYTGSPLRGAANTEAARSAPTSQTEGKVAPDPDRNPITRAPDSTEAIASSDGTKVTAKVTAEEAKALDTAQKLVSTTLIKPILAQARAARDAPAPWGQTQAEKQFGALLDNRLSDDIAKASNFPIAQRIADQILKNSPIDSAAQNQPTYTPVDLFG